MARKSAKTADPLARARLATEKAKAQLAEIERQEKPPTGMVIPYCPHLPHPKQEAFLKLDCLEALFGGAGIGGKSEALLMGALQYVQVPGYAALILRRTISEAELEGALLTRAHKWLQGTDAVFEPGNNRFVFPSGASLSFGYLKNKWDELRYDSSEFQYIGFDELTHFEMRPYTYLFSRLRRNVGMMAVPLRMRAGTNPGGIGHRWVKERFLLAEHPDRRFIPATIDDNPSADRDSYMRSLDQMSAIDRAQKMGDWDAEAGDTLFSRNWFSECIIGPDQLPLGLRPIRAWDMAATAVKPGSDPDWTVGLKLAEHRGQYYILDVRRFRERPAETENRIRQTARQDGIATWIYQEQEPGSAGVIVSDHYARNVLKGYTFRSQRSTGSKVERAAPVVAAAQRGNVFLLRGQWNSEFLDELELFPFGPHDDQVDALSLGFGCLNRRNRIAKSF